MPTSLFLLSGMCYALSLPEMCPLSFKAQPLTLGRSSRRYNPTIAPPFGKLMVLNFTCGRNPVQSATMGLS